MKNEWLTREEFLEYCRRKPVDPLLRLLLTSDGTLTQHLESLSLGPIGVAVQQQREVLIEKEQSAWMDAPAGEKAIERTVWLTSQAKSTGEGADPRKIFAVSTLPLSKLKPDLHHEILLGVRPIGQIIEARRLPTRRDRLEISLLSRPEIAAGFGLPQDRLLWARRYRLNISDQVMGLLFEVFSPSLSPSS